MRILLTATAIGLVLAQPLAADSLELRRVLLSTGGVGYLEHEAHIDGDATLALTVRLDQVDDVLKSLVVFDDLGGVGSIGLPGPEPLREVFRELPFDQAALESPTALLRALRGAEVEVVGMRGLEGRLVSVVPEESRDEDGVRVRQRVTLMTAEGLRQFLLEEADSVRFLDPALDAQVRRALEALARHGERERRTLEVRTRGGGPRRLTVGYVVEAPMWKSAYRVVLGDDDMARLQGYAVLENLSGEDWREVELTVVSGRPVTFRQALYESYFVDRPEVPVEVVGRLLPGVDEGVRAMAPPATAMRDAPAMLAMEAMPMPAPVPAPARPAPIEAAEAVEAPTQVVFRSPVPVSVTSGHSLMLPIVDRVLPAERVSLYRPDEHATRPFAALLIVNDTGTGLPPGVLTLYEQDAGGTAFVGDARLATLPAGEERLVAYALDERMHIERDRAEARRITAARLVDGALEVTVEERATAVYRLTGAAETPRVVLLEHAARQGFELDGPEPEGRIDGGYRFRVALEAGESRELRVVEKRPLHQRYELLDADDATIRTLVAAAELTPAMREAIAGIQPLRAEVASRRRAVERLGSEIAALVEDQARLRANLGAVPQGTDLHRRYLAELGSQEDRLAALRDERAAAEKALAEAEAALRDHVRGLTL
jgi:hypothetical protein